DRDAGLAGGDIDLKAGAACARRDYLDALGGDLNASARPAVGPQTPFLQLQPVVGHLGAGAARKEQPRSLIVPQKRLGLGRYRPALTAAQSFVAGHRVVQDRAAQLDGGAYYFQRGDRGLPLEFGAASATQEQGCRTEQPNNFNSVPHVDPTIHKYGGLNRSPS